MPCRRRPLQMRAFVTTLDRHTCTCWGGHRRQGRVCKYKWWGQDVGDLRREGWGDEESRKRGMFATRHATQVCWGGTRNTVHGSGQGAARGESSPPPHGNHTPVEPSLPEARHPASRQNISWKRAAHKRPPPMQTAGSAAEPPVARAGYESPGQGRGRQLRPNTNKRVHMRPCATHEPQTNIATQRREVSTPPSFRPPKTAACPPSSLRLQNSMSAAGTTTSATTQARQIINLDSLLGANLGQGRRSRTRRSSRGRNRAPACKASRCEAKEYHDTYNWAPCTPPAGTPEQPWARTSAKSKWAQGKLEPKRGAHMACNTKRTWLLNDGQCEHARTDHGQSNFPQWPWRPSNGQPHLGSWGAFSSERALPEGVATIIARACIEAAGVYALLGCTRSAMSKKRGGELTIFVFGMSGQ